MERQREKIKVTKEQVDYIRRAERSKKKAHNMSTLIVLSTIVFIAYFIALAISWAI